MKPLFATLMLALALPVAAEPLQDLQEGWAKCQYQLPEKEREGCFTALVTQANAATQKEPFRTDLVIWNGIIKSSYAGAKGGMDALSLVKEAKAHFEIAIKQDPKALNGAALTSLGSLYYQVPGWPIGFGDEAKAQEYLQQGLTVAPDDIDANYFYADFLLDQGEKAEAKRYFEKALAAPPRTGRASADEGRRAEIKAKLAQL